MSAPSVPTGVTVDAPWGSWKILSHEPGRETIKMLTINAGGILSLQKHMRRGEEWRPLDDGIVVYTESHAIPPKKGALWLRQDETFTIGTHMAHRLINPTAYPVRVLEIIRGQYDEKDIERLHDAYGRK